MAGRTLTIDMQDVALIPAGSTVSDLNYASVSANDRKRIAAVTNVLAVESHLSWVNLEKPDRQRGLLNLTLLRRALEL